MQITESIQSKIDMQDNNESIQYYQYLRETMEVSEIAYWIGNPSVEIISGKVLLQPLGPINSKKQPENYQLYLKEIFNANYYHKNKTQSKQHTEQQSHKPQEILEKQQAIEKPEQFQKKQQNIENIAYFKRVNRDNNMNSRCLIICGIPNSKSPVQVMQTECISRYINLITQIRVIKTVHIRYYAMLLLMKDHSSLCEFYNQVFAQQYTSLEMQRIIIRQIRAITVSFSQLVIENGNNQMNLLREINQNSQEIPPQNIFMTYHHMKLQQQQALNPNMNKTNNSYSELVCAICFDVCNQQAISILCGHYFDLQCLQKWSENICPLCRYHQQPPIIKFCQKCNQCEGLWVCLICGSRLCCGVNHDILGDDSHIYQHFKLTNHSLSMQLQTKFLFDAKIPAFLHQKFYKDLILSSNKQSKSSSHQMQEKDNSDQCNKKNKITQQIQQYESQVSQQMKKQRLYFQQHINQKIKQHRNILAKKRQHVESLQTQIDSIDNQQIQINKQIIQAQTLTEKYQKQLQIIKNLIKMKQQKVKEKRQQITKNNQLKINTLKQLQNQIKEKKQEILNYRKNLQLKERLTQKLKGESVQGEFILTANQQKGKNKKKHKK